MTMMLKAASTTSSLIAALGVLFFAATTTTEAYIFNAQAHPALGSVAKVIPGIAFGSRLEFSYNDARGKKNELAIKGPVFELTDVPSSLSSSGSTISLPNANGLQPNLSTGSKQIKVHELASFIGMQGVENVLFEKGCWEMAWMSNQREGQLICAFHVPLPIRRSSAVITNGNMFFCFRVYTYESLAEGHEMKRNIQEQNAEAIREKEMHLEKMNATPNVIMKAVHYRNAFAAFEKILYAPQVAHIPDGKGTIELSNGLLLAPEGSIYRKGNALIGPSWHKIGKVILSKNNNSNDALPDHLKNLKP